MNDFSDVLFPVPTDQLAALRAQRLQLGGLIEEITAGRQKLVSMEASAFWNSSAQRAYRLHVDNILHELRGVLGYLNDADDQLWRSLCQLQAAAGL